jgi:translation initiation factor 2A
MIALLNQLTLTSRVSICDADSSQELQRLPLTGVIDIKFSPKGTWIATWERYGQFTYLTQRLF